MTGRIREKIIEKEDLLVILQQPLGAYWEVQPHLPLTREPPHDVRVYGLSHEKGVGYRVELGGSSILVPGEDVLRPNPWTIVFRGAFGDGKYGAVLVLRHALLWPREQRAREERRWQVEREFVQATEEKRRHDFELSEQLREASGEERGKPLLNRILNPFQLAHVLNDDKRWLIERGRFSRSHGPANGQKVLGIEVDAPNLRIATPNVTIEVPIGDIVQVSETCIEMRQTVYSRQSRRRTLGGGYREIKEFCTTLQFVRD